MLKRTYLANPNFSPGCPYPYVYEPGTTTLMNELQQHFDNTLDIDDCAHICDGDPECCSFYFLKKEGQTICEIYSSCIPTTTGASLNHSRFCTKGIQQYLRDIPDLKVFFGMHTHGVWYVVIYWF